MSCAKRVMVVVGAVICSLTVVAPSGAEELDIYEANRGSTEGEPPGAVAPTAVHSYPASGIDLVGNGSFESGSFPPWQVWNSTSGGDWYVTGALSGPNSGRSLDPPSDGALQAVVDQTGSGAHILYQDIALPASAKVTLSFTYWIKNEAGTYSNPDTLNKNVSPNQQFRVDIMDPSVPIDVVTVGVLQNIIATTPVDPTIVPLTSVEVDLTPLAGQTIRLRFAEVDNQNFFRVGVDSVHLEVSPFEEVASGIPGRDFATLDWGDFDSDGDLDLLLTGATAGVTFVSEIYENDAGAFSNIGASLLGLADGVGQWVDYDGDGDLDVFLSGFDQTLTQRTRLYENQGGTFVWAWSPLYGFGGASSDWGDYDLDGDLDLLIAGETQFLELTSVYENIDGTFTAIPAGLPGFSYGTCRWIDYDKDGDLDVFLSGNGMTEIYENDAGGFTAISSGLPSHSLSACDWGDYDNDGDPDLLLTGVELGLGSSAVFRNDNGNFVDIGAPLVGVQLGSARWGDHDNDGDLDILITGSTGSIITTPVSRVYENTGSGFVDVDAGFLDLDGGEAIWGDYDTDGDLDVLIVGSDNGFPSSSLWTRLYRNNAAIGNTPPDTPATPFIDIIGSSVNIIWGYASDAETPFEGLSYNMRLGTSEGASDLMPSHADPSTGYRRLVAVGNQGQRITTTIDLPLVSKFTCAVQTIDHNFAGSTFSGEETVYLSADLWSVQDAPNDQGGWVRIRFRHSDLDDASQTVYPISSYNVWRRDDAAPAPGVLRTQAASPTAAALASVVGGETGIDSEEIETLNLLEWRGRLYKVGSDGEAGTLPPGVWELVGNYAAAQQYDYLVEAHTKADSTVANGTHWSVFVVSGHTTTPSVWFASDPDSGYSLDNIAPAAPGDFAVDGVSPQGDVSLSWKDSPDEDFQYFELHRSTSSGFDPGESTLVAQLTATSYTDIGASQGNGALFYRLIAFDHAGNGSEIAETATGTVAAGDADQPIGFALHAIVPNPMQSDGVIRFSLPVSLPVTLALYDARGRLVRTAYQEQMCEAGRHEWSWDLRDREGMRVSAGVYFYRLQAGAFAQTRKLVVLE